MVIKFHKADVFHHPKLSQYLTRLTPVIIIVLDFAGMRGRRDRSWISRMAVAATESSPFFEMVSGRIKIKLHRPHAS